MKIISERFDVSPKPFLRWAGGKSWLIKHLKSNENTKFEQYHEPFLGGAAMFFFLQPKRKSFISDLNLDLIETYNEVKHNAPEVIEILKTFKNIESQYYEIRGKQYNSSIERAAKFIYLNQTSYNGIYRVNLKGEYNVPFGFRSKSFLNVDNLLYVMKALKNTTIKNQDFYDSIINIRKNDLVFLDPPYTVSHNNNGFIKYNEKIFSLDDQVRLSYFIDELKKKGAYYILTNAAHDIIDKIFDKGDKKIILKRASLVGGLNSKRGQTNEFVFTNTNFV